MIIWHPEEPVTYISYTKIFCYRTLRKRLNVPTQVLRPRFRNYNTNKLRFSN